MTIQNPAKAFNSTGHTVKVTTDKSPSVVKNFSHIEVKTNEFNQALSQSLTNSGLYSLSSDPATRSIAAYIKTYNRFDEGIKFGTELEIEYTLKDSKETTIYQSVISSSHIATVGDAFAGGARLARSYEGAVKNNFEKLLPILNEIEKYKKDGKKVFYKASEINEQITQGTSIEEVISILLFGNIINRNNNELTGIGVLPLNENQTSTFTGLARLNGFELQFKDGKVISKIFHENEFGYRRHFFKNTFK
jgi:predicted RNase H-like nuclease (RuvC/YqgF family)